MEKLKKSRGKGIQVSSNQLWRFVRLEGTEVELVTSYGDASPKTRTVKEREREKEKETDNTKVKRKNSRVWARTVEVADRKNTIRSLMW